MAKNITQTPEKHIINGEVIDGAANSDTALMPLGDFDSELKWDEWIDDLRETQGAGKVTAYKLPLGPDGNPNPSAKGSKQIRLGSWPHDQFDMDELIDVIRRDFMDPGETAGIRLSGTVPGRKGSVFNQIVTIKKPRTADGVVPPPSSELVAVVREMREYMSRPHALEVSKTSFMESLGPMMPHIAPIISAIVVALIQRPKPKSDLGELINAMAQLKEFTEGNSSENESEDSSLASIIKAVAPAGLQLLGQLAANAPRGAIQTPVGNSRPIHARTIRPATGTAPSAPQHIPPSTEGVVSPSPTQLSQETQAMLAQLAPQLEQLAVMAENGANPEETAAYVMTVLPDDPEFDARFAALLENTAAFNALKFHSAKIKAQWPWFEALRVALLKEFEEPAPDAPTT